MRKNLWIVALLLLAHTTTSYSQLTVGDTPTRAVATDGSFISWKEHIIDDRLTSGVPFNGSDGLEMADLDRDGIDDIVSVHESDSTYDSTAPGETPPAMGHVRIAFGSNNPYDWTNITLAEGADASAAEDAAIADVNGDGFLDIMVAAELSHLIYFQNPGQDIRNRTWERLILPMTQGRGSYIRVFLADLDGDGRPEAVAPNKGAQRPTIADYRRSTPASIYKVTGDPLNGSNWQEIELGRFSNPRNSEPIDIDQDGDLDIIVGSNGENRIILFENIEPNNLNFEEHAIGVYGPRTNGFNMEFLDINNDGRLDIIGASGRTLTWFEQPEDVDHTWVSRSIGSFAPDSMTGFEIADINDDGLVDIIAGSYSRGPRTGDGEVDKNDSLGRIGWFENPGNIESEWVRHDISRRKRGMFDRFIARDLDNDGDIDFVGTRGNSDPYDGVFWLEQVRTNEALPAFQRARDEESEEVPLP
ncbi:MAG: VCBS repeat-containing protein [Pseudomonadota bacterium]|nr:VCBS repeat-containing protein [Pseudomonadota bacterium]MED5530603.1 VCBS repeat-containing protein [Pseudomonadota bacterium]|tara:strand:+ start:6219 stop:7637 length:1419 start_codon:yes stop_codon:yes gene_type:complete